MTRGSNSSPAINTKSSAACWLPPRGDDRDPLALDLQGPYHRHPGLALAPVIIETYYISPTVYGNQLRLSSLAVILAFAVGADLGGVVGALVALPIAAMYPTIENLWLAGRLAPEVAADHRRIEHTKEH